MGNVEGGADARKICIDHWKADTVHGEGSPYLKIAGLGGYICLLGVDQDRNTSMHSVEALLRSSGKMKTFKIGNAVTRLIKSQDLIELLTDAGRNDPTFCLCDNPECADCVSQRAVIFRDTIGIENFKLAASAALSGRYVPQITASFYEIAQLVGWFLALRVHRMYIESKMLSAF